MVDSERFRGGAELEAVRVERLDHFGLMASVIKAVGRISLIDARLVPDTHAALTPGEAVAGMLLTGVGVAHRPRSVTPQFFANTPLDLRLRAGGAAQMCKRCTLGRTLAEVQVYGGARWCRALALAGCAHEGIAPRFPHLDPTSFSLRGASVPARDAQAMRLPSGYAKDHRPEVTQAVLERLGAQEGGGPLVRTRWDGQASATEMFQERAQALRQALARAPTPRSLVADAQLSPEDTAAPLAQRGFLPRLPGTRTRVSQGIPPGLKPQRWQPLEATTR
jgi:uncharacterized protein DUF4277